MLFKISGIQSISLFPCICQVWMVSQQVFDGSVMFAFHQNEAPVIKLLAALISRIESHLDTLSVHFMVILMSNLPEVCFRNNFWF